MENHHAINGYLNYFNWAIFNSYVSLPEGNMNDDVIILRIMDWIIIF